MHPKPKNNAAAKKGKITTKFRFRQHTPAGGCWRIFFYLYFRFSKKDKKIFQFASLTTPSKFFDFFRKCFFLLPFKKTFLRKNFFYRQALKNSTRRATQSGSPSLHSGGSGFLARPQSGFFFNAQRKKAQ